MRNGRLAISNNIGETENLFYWIASRSTSEWSFADAKTYDGRRAMIGTMRYDGSSITPRPNQHGLGDFVINRFIHSHYGTSWDDIRYSRPDARYARELIDINPKAKSYLYVPLLTKDVYNDHIKNRPGYKPTNYEPNKIIPIIPSYD